jgi:hypothetical protein
MDMNSKKGQAKSRQSGNATPRDVLFPKLERTEAVGGIFQKEVRKGEANFLLSRSVRQGGPVYSLSFRGRFDTVLGKN